MTAFHLQAAVPALFPHDDAYVLPVEADVRRREAISIGDLVQASTEVVGR